MGCYVIAVGGTGNKILESLVYAACADVFGGVSHLDMLSVDVDASCGNTPRAKRAAECYQNVREALETGAPPHRCFHTAVNVRQWDMNLSRRAASVEKMAQNHSRDRLLARTLFTPAEARLEYSEGFRGHPDLGVLFFADLLSSLEKRRQSGQPDELNAMLDRMEALVKRLTALEACLRKHADKLDCRECFENEVESREGRCTGCTLQSCTGSDTETSSENSEGKKE